MKRVITLLLCLMLLLSFNVFAMDFNAEDIYNSVVVVYTPKGVGSGFSIADNLIVTNAHVVENYTNVQISTYKGNSYKGAVTKKDTHLDIAILKLEGKDLPELEINTETAIGAEIYAIGAPKDMPYTMTKGIISAVDRKIRGFAYLQIDASINGGNSGGPLLNARGEVIGVNTLKVEGAEGIGLAIPIQAVLDFIHNNNIKIDAGNTETAPKENSTDTVAKSEYLKIVKTNQILLTATIALSLLCVVLIFLLILMGKKPKKQKYKKEELDFEIEILE